MIEPISSETISLSKFARETELSKSTVSNLLTELNLPTNKGLTSDMQVSVLVLNSSKKDARQADSGASELAERNHLDIAASDLATIEPSSVEIVSGSLSSYQPVQTITPLSFTQVDNSDNRLSIANQVQAQLQQTEANRAAIEQAKIKQAEERGAELALRAWQAEQAAYTQVSQQLQVSGAEVLGLIKKQQSEQS